MQLKISVKTNLNIKEVNEKILKAARLAMRDIVIDNTQDAKENSPVSPMWPSIDKSGRVPTGNNKRCIAGVVSGMGMVKGSGKDATEEKVVDDSGIQGAVYGTSSYSGYLEVGTSLMPARPYIKPAVDKNFTPEKFEKLLKGHLGESQNGG